MREPGMPWKRNMAGEEGEVEPYVAKPRVRAEGRVYVWVSLGCRWSLDGEGGTWGGRWEEKGYMVGRFGWFCALLLFQVDVL